MFFSTRKSTQRDKCQCPPFFLGRFLLYIHLYMCTYPGKMSGGIQAGSRQSHPGSQVGMAGSRLRWWDPTFPTWDENLIPPGIPHLMRDSCIPPGILGGTYAFYPGSWSGFTYPTWDSLSHPQKYCFAVFILTKHFFESSNTYESSTHCKYFAWDMISQVGNYLKFEAGSQQGLVGFQV